MRHFIMSCRRTGSTSGRGDKDDVGERLMPWGINAVAETHEESGTEVNKRNGTGTGPTPNAPPPRRRRASCW